MKENSVKWLVIFLLIILVVFLIVLMVLLLRKDSHLFSFFHFREETKIILEEEYNIEQIHKIIVDTSIADIKFLPSENNKAKVIIYGEEKDKTKAKSVIEKNILSISSEKKNRICFGFCFFGKEEIYVYLPENEIKQIELKTISGDIEMATFMTSDMQLKTTSGDIYVQNAGNVNIYSTSGDIKLKSGKNVEIKTVSGEVEAQKIEGKTKITTTSGDIEINHLKSMANGEIKTVSGEVEIERIENTYVETKSVSGDIQIANNNRTAEYTLSIKTTSGDITIN